MYVKALNLIDVIVMRRAGSAHSVPTPRSYVVTQHNLDREKPVSFLCRIT